jgi:two-component system phosphate regulon sensor histidine kinase PhoR
LVVLSDLTRLHKLERIRSDFAANVSHELRTPITAAKGYLETLRDDTTSDPGQTTKFLDISLKHLDRLNAIIEDLLRLARLEQETGQVELKNTDLEAVAEAAINSCLNRAQQRNVTLVLEPIGSLWIRANGQLLEQALTNLLDNAIKYSNPGGTVEIGSEHSSNEIVIKVSDKGCGIEEQHLPRLFERFYRVDADRSRKLGGTGLGLAIVKHIILAHNGHLSVESEIGRGSAFKIHLPTT